MPEDVDAFIERWSRAAASECANAQQFLIELADLLGVPRPGNDHGAGYSFEFPLKIPRPDGTFTQGFIDLYRRRSFVLEAKQFQSESEPPTPLQVVAEEAGLYTAKKKSGPVRGSEAWDDAMIKARGQAGRTLTAKEQIIHEQGLVSVLLQLHEDLDAAVAAAYGWPTDLPDAEILTRLVALNAERAAEESGGTIRWLRPEYQRQKVEGAKQQSEQTNLQLPPQPATLFLSEEEAPLAQKSGRPRPPG